MASSISGLTLKVDGGQTWSANCVPRTCHYAWPRLFRVPPNPRLLLTGPSSCGASAAAALRFLRDRRGGCAAAAPQQKRRALGGRRDASQPPSLALAPTRGTTSVPGFHPITRRREEL